MADDREEPVVPEPLRALAALRYQPRPGRWEALALAPARAPRASRVPRAVRWAGALAACVAALLVWRAAKAEPAWDVWVTAGEVRTAAHLSRNAWLETAANETALVKVSDIGTVRVAPGSAVQLVATGRREHRLALRRGALHAVVDAPPRLFVVDTPQVTAVDLGCEYSVAVLGDERTLLTVERGLVALEGQGRSTVVLAGMQAVSRTGRPPGTPLALDASEALRAAVDRFDVTGAPAELERIAAEARGADAPTLWHLLPSAPPRERAVLFERLAALVPPPAGWVAAAAEDPRSPPMQAWWAAIRSRRAPRGKAE